jgi:hypothetical protein
MRVVPHRHCQAMRVGRRAQGEPPRVSLHAGRWEERIDSRLLGSNTIEFKGCDRPSRWPSRFLQRPELDEAARPKRCRRTC